MASRDKVVAKKSCKCCIVSHTRLLGVVQSGKTSHVAISTRQVSRLWDGTSDDPHRWCILKLRYIQIRDRALVYVQFVGLYFNFHISTYTRVVHSAASSKRLRLLVAFKSLPTGYRLPIYTYVYFKHQRDIRM